MARILIVHEDALLRGRYRKLLERTGHEVSEITRLADRDYLPRSIIYDRIITSLAPLTDDSIHDPFPLDMEVLYASHPRC